MKIGLVLPNVSPLGTRSNLLTFAVEGEQLGYDSLWVTERLLFPLQPKQLYTGRGPWPETYKYVLDPLDALIFVAGVTKRIRLGTSLIDFPLYTPAHLAKRIATLDVLSDGRAVICGGLGWSEDEFIASNVPFDQRSGRLTEMIHALNALWGPDPVEFDGKYYTIPESVFGPKPIQKPRPPLLLGGSAPTALDRAARLADGFNPIGFPKIEAVEQLLGAARKAWHDAAREPAKPEIIVRVNHGFISDQEWEGPRPFLAGTVSQVRADVQRLAAWGATEVFFDLTARYASQPDGFQKMVEQARLLRQVV